MHYAARNRPGIQSTLTQIMYQQDNVFIFLIQATFSTTKQQTGTHKNSNSSPFLPSSSSISSGGIVGFSVSMAACKLSMTTLKVSPLLSRNSFTLFPDSGLTSTSTVELFTAVLSHVSTPDKGRIKQIFNRIPSLKKKSKCKLILSESNDQS